MLVEDVNELIRTSITELIDSGWLKTHIGNVLLGPNGQAHLNHFLKQEDNKLPNNFGVKPLQRISQVIGYDTHLVFIHPDDTEGLQSANEANHQFIENLTVQLVEYLSNSAKHVNRPKGRSQIDDVLDDMLSD